MKQDNGQSSAGSIKFIKIRQGPLRNRDDEPVREEELIGTIERARRFFRQVIRARTSERKKTGIMKNAHPIVSARTSSPVGPDSTGLDESVEPIIRLKLQKPLHWEWELTTSADALPVIQLLDKNGRLLVETTGRTAQRARGSFREGLRIHEQFPIDEARINLKSKEQISSPSTSSSASSFVATALQGNRNFDGFSNKFGTCNFAPRKSRSDVNIKEGRGRKKHSAVEDATMKTKNERNIEEATTGFKIYSAGDYLRQQIMNDLHTRDTIGQTPEEIAKNRCRKVKAYLRSQSESLLNFVREEDCDGDRTKNAKIRSNEKNARSRSLKRNDTVSSEKKNLNEENRKVKSYQTRTTVIPPDNLVKESSKLNEENDRVVRKIKDDTNEEELTRIRAFLRDKIQRRMNMEQARSRSAVRTGASEIVESGIKKRYSDYSHEDNRKNYRTRKVRSETSILRFDPEVLERERLKSGKQLEKEKSNCRGSSEDSQLQRQSRDYRQSRSEVLVEALEPDDQAKSQLKRASSNLEKRKLYRKTKSDVLLGQAAATAMTTGASSGESTKVLFNPPRRIKSQENVERSWREYKERKRSEKLRRESEREVPEEDDFMSKPRWKDLQRDFCFSRNCKICQNLRNCVNPFHERGENSHQKSEELSSKNETAAKFPEDEISSTNNSRPGTSLQENYLLVVEGDADRSPVIAQIQTRDRGNVGGVSAIGINSPDFGYNSIPSKNAFKDYRELYAHSNVKKSDTFKIVDGSEDLEERANDSDSKINGGGSSDSDLGYLNGEGLLANKSNEDITKDYFKRVYELLKRRQEEVRKSTNGSHEFPGHDDSSSSNYVEEIQTKRQRRKKKDKSPQGKI